MAQVEHLLEGKIRTGNNGRAHAIERTKFRARYARTSMFCAPRLLGWAVAPISRFSGG